MHFPDLFPDAARLRRAPWLLLCLLAPLAAAVPEPAPAGQAPLQFHFPEGGAAPWLYLLPGGKAPEGVVADILATAARATGRPLKYEFQPREQASDSLRSGSADGALYYTVTRPPTRELVLSESLAKLDTVLVALAGSPVNYRYPSSLRDQKLCTLTQEIYPPLALLSMRGELYQTRAKTEQAALMMLRLESCKAAVLSGPTWRWFASRSDWSDLRAEPKPLLREDLVLGFASREREFAGAVSNAVRDMRSNGKLAQRINRWLAEDLRDDAPVKPARVNSQIGAR